MRRFFCDESGNSGSNYLEEQQPYYIISGFLEPRYNYNIPKDCLNQFIKINNEVKSTDLLNKDLEKMLDNLKSIIDLGYKPFLAVVDKKFAIACRLESFIFNKENVYLANCIYKLINTELMNDFTKTYMDTFKLYNNKINKNLEICLEKILANLTPLLSENEHNSLEEIKKMIEYTLDPKNKTEKNKIDQSPNYFAFGSLLSVLVEFTKENNEFIEIYHDNIDGFDKSLKNVFIYLKEYDEYKMLKSLNFVDSNSLIQVQLADHLSGILNYFFKNNFNKDLDEEQKLNIDLIKNFLTENIKYSRYENEYNAHLMIPICWEKEFLKTNI